MRWTIIITIILILAVIAWFLFPRIQPSISEDPFGLVPEETWLIMEVQDASDLKRLNDSLSIYERFEVFSGFEEISRALPVEVKTRSTRLILGHYGADDHFVLAFGDDLPKEGFDGFSYVHASNDFMIYATSEIRQTGSTTELREMMKLPLTDERLMRFHARSSLLVAQFKSYLLPMLYDRFRSEIEGNTWITFDVSDQDGLFAANGIGNTKMDESNRERDLHIMRYLPSGTGMCMLQTVDSLSFGVAYCPYDYTSESSEMKNVFVVTEIDAQSVRLEHSEQNYRDIPISLGNEDSRLEFLEIPWLKEAYVAHLGSIQVSAKSFEQLVQYIDDYLADDKLSQSNYFGNLERFISDASFTFFLRPDLLSGSNPFIGETDGLATINSMVVQAFSELPEQKFYSIAMLHHQEIVDAANVLWSVPLDGEVQAGPWAFKNHYTNKPEVIVQDDQHQLYLISHEGKTLWKKRLDGPVHGDVSMVDAYDNKKYQLLLNTEKKLYLIDRNGRDVAPFPIKIENGTSVGPSLVKYRGEKEYRLMYADGLTVKNIDLEGNEVKGWSNPELDTLLAMPIQYLYFSGKDYLVVKTHSNKARFLHRSGNDRLDPVDVGKKITHFFLMEGSSLSSTTFVGFDSLGNVYNVPTSGEIETHNVLPLGGNIGFNVGKSGKYRYLSVQGDHVIVLDEKLDVTLDYLLPESVDPSIDWISQEKGWIGLKSSESKHYYILNVDGTMLDKMPLSGTGSAILMNLDGEGADELVISNGHREIVAYELAD